MDKKKLILLAALLSLFVVLVVVYINLGGAEKPRAAQPVSPIPDDPESTESRELQTVVLFFPSEQDGLLHQEEREIIPEVSISLQAKRIISELLSGSRLGFLSPIPPGTRLRELYITEEGVAYVDFSREIMDKHLSGSSAEISTIYSIVNSLAYNLEPIKKVFILVDGGEKKTLSGHIDMTSPFQPIYDIVSE
jgi:spore germination protein GerM